MTYIQGMIRNKGYGGVESSGLECIRIGEMRPLEEFHEGDRVRCPEVRELHLGVIVKIDADVRLAQVNWMGGYLGWWYLKDLVVVGYAIKLKAKTLSTNYANSSNLEEHKNAKQITTKSTKDTKSLVEISA